jgi:hypothetical protein
MTAAGAKWTGGKGSVGEPPGIWGAARVGLALAIGFVPVLFMEVAEFLLRRLILLRTPSCPTTPLILAPNLIVGLSVPSPLCSGTSRGGGEKPIAMTSPLFFACIPGIVIDAPYEGCLATICVGDSPALSRRAAGILVPGVGSDVEGVEFDSGVESWPPTKVSEAGPDVIDFISGGSVETVVVGFAVGWTNFATGGGLVLGPVLSVNCVLPPAFDIDPDRGGEVAPFDNTGPALPRRRLLSVGG